MDYAKLFRKYAALKKRDLDPGAKVLHSEKELASTVRPGDIILSKSEETKLDLGNKLTSWWTGSRWYHGGIVLPDNKIIHNYKPISHYRINEDAEMKVRQHDITTLPRLGRDVLILRPDLSRSRRLAAANLAKSFINKPYDYTSWLRAAFLRGKKSGRKEGIPEKMICTAVPGFAYPELKLGGAVSRRYLRATDFLRNPHLRSVAAYSREGVIRGT